MSWASTMAVSHWEFMRKYVDFLHSWLQICHWNRGTSIQHVRDLGGVPVWWSDEQEVAGSDKNLPISDHSDHYQERKETILDLLTKTHGHIIKITLEHLILSGALDSIHGTRKTLLENKPTKIVIHWTFLSFGGGCYMSNLIIHLAALRLSVLDANSISYLQDLARLCPLVP